MKIISLVFMLLGTFIGAGFIGGREVYEYFAKYGSFAFSMIILFSILFCGFVVHDDENKKTVKKTKNILKPLTGYDLCDTMLL